MWGKYSIQNVLKDVRDNQERIQAHLKGETYEGLDEPTGTVAAFGIVGALVVLAIMLGIWIWALMVTIKFWKVLPDWAKVLGVIGLVTGVGPVVTLIAVYIGKGQGSKFKY